ncbi:hypothetical protein ACSV4D_07515 [Flavobacterium sp. ARAG 55.4]|uniref:hypothetical protein n=1 Tax=Flavobacterium sp. ARAG 55.4 TaxID=3451357 RepID=UPI003F47E21A
MKLIKLTSLIFGLLLLGCNQTDSKKHSVINEEPIDTAENSISQDKEGTNDELKDYEIDSIKTVITLFKEKDIDRISNKISYPLHRQYPIPTVKDKEEFKKRFSEIFDQILLYKISNSKISQWSEVGWRGIMLDNGDLWMANSDGVITTVNYQSDFEKNLRTNLIAKDKENLHVSLKTFQSPVYKIKTSKYIIRIDEISNNNYRYASWKVDERETSKPADIVLNNGQWEHLGSGGNHVITFINGIYTYKVYRNITGEDNSPDITLEIEKNGEIISTADGRLLIE